MKVVKILAAIAVLTSAMSVQANTLVKAEQLNKNVLNESVKAELTVAMTSLTIQVDNTAKQAQKILVKQSYQLASQKTAQLAQADTFAE